MQKIKRKKKQKKRVEFLSKEITPGKHKRIGNLNYYSEEIAKELIDKIISLTITRIFRENVESKISNFCLKSVMHILNLSISISNINHDRDNIYDIENISDDKKRLNTDENRFKIVNHNKCKKIRYKKLEKDMFEYIKIKRDLEEELRLKNKNIDDYLNKSVNFETIINRKKNIKSNFWGEITQPNSLGLQRFVPKSNILNKVTSVKDKNKENPKINIMKKNILSKLRPSSKKLSIFSFRESDSKIEENNLQESIFKKERKYYILEMSKMKKIKDDNTKMEETEEIKELRKLKLERIKFLKEEEKRLNKSKKFEIRNNSKLQYNLDTINLTNQEKKKNIQVQRKIIESEIQKGNFTFDFNNNLILVRPVQPDYLYKDFPEAITKQRDKVKEKEKEKEKENHNLIEKEEKKFQSGTNTDGRIIRKSLIEEKDKHSINYLTSKYGWKIEPSGSNFRLINPEVGVKVYEKGEVKTGGNQYLVKYKRFSITDYGKMLKGLTDDQEMNNTILTKGKEEENKIDNIKKNNSIEISKLNKDLCPFRQNVKNIKLNILKTKKKMNKSRSEIFTIDRASLYKNLLINEEKVIDIKKIKNKNEKAFTHRIDANTLFLNKMKNIMNKKNKKTFHMVDSFNKNIIRNINFNSKIDKTLKSLPLLPLKKNKSYIFSKKDKFFRTRMKKIVEN